MKTIVLLGRQNSSLDWKREIAEAEASAGPIRWEFDLGLTDPYFPLEDELKFQALALSLKTFADEVWPRFQDRTQGAVLYRGTADFSRFFLWSERQEANYEEWKEGRAVCSEEHMKRLFCAEAFGAYFQMLAHKLPDELNVVLCLKKERAGTRAETEHLYSPERFEHFQVEIEGDARGERVGVCFPEECGQEELEALDGWMEQLQEPARAVPESLLTENWDGLDLIYVLGHRMSERGKRKLRGFEAAGGVVEEIRRK